MSSFIPRSDYHSAHKPALTTATAQRVRIGRSLAFVHDIIAKPLPRSYADCDVLYADLPWRNGMTEFNRRAEMDDDQHTYARLMQAVSRIVGAVDKPLVLVTGTHALKSLPEPDTTMDVLLNQDRSVAMFYNYTPDEPLDTATEILNALAAQYSRVGDFCCGYGRTLKIFSRAGKTFVGSDYNPHCIGYIAAHAKEWTRVQSK